MVDKVKNSVIVMSDGSRIRGCFSFVLRFTDLRVSTRLHQQTMLVKRLRFCFQTVCIWEQCHFSFCFVFCPDRGKRCTGGAVAGSRNSISGQGFFVPRKESKECKLRFASFGVQRTTNPAAASVGLPCALSMGLLPEALRVGIEIHFAKIFLEFH